MGIKVNPQPIFSNGFTNISVVENSKGLIFAPCRPGMSHIGQSASATRKDLIMRFFRKEGCSQSMTNIKTS